MFLYGSNEPHFKNQPHRTTVILFDTQHTRYAEVFLYLWITIHCAFISGTSDLSSAKSS